MRIIGGHFKHRQLMIPKQGTRPTLGAVREAVFNMCQGSIEGARVLDLFAGSGAIGLEALSRGAAHVTFVEKGKEAIRCLKQNIAALGVESQSTLYPLSVLQALTIIGKLNAPFDLIYADPPYGEGWGPLILQAIDTQELLKKEGALFIEESMGALKELPPTRLSLVKERRTGRSVLSLFTQPIE